MSEEIKNLESVLTFNGRPIMTPSRAKEVLEGMGADFDAFFLYVYGQVSAYKDIAHIGASLSADQLQAIALWMQDPEGVTNA